MVNKTEKKDEISGIILSRSILEKLRNIDMKSCKVLIEIITIMKAMKQRSVLDLENLIAKERPEVIQGLAEVKGFGAEQQLKKI